MSPALAGGFFTTEPPGKPLELERISLTAVLLGVFGGGAAFKCSVMEQSKQEINMYEIIKRIKTRK